MWLSNTIICHMDGSAILDSSRDFLPIEVSTESSKVLSDLWHLQSTLKVNGNGGNPTDGAVSHARNRLADVLFRSHEDSANEQQKNGDTRV